MQRDTVVILGIPVDNVTLSEAVERIFQLVGDYKNDGVPRQVATVNVDFIVNTLTWEQGGVRHPELLDVLRRADLVTADGMPVVWMSRLLGCPLKERVTGADLVPALAAQAARRGVSLFFLGGRGDVGRRAADLLVRQNPDLKVAGVSAPFVYTEGEQLAAFEAEDAAIVEEINAARPDVLLIAFGNPKQELWFARNALRLKVPVSIGIGGTFEFIVGTVPRAPLWIQRAGLEWVYRILMEPQRLWKRYAVGTVKFALHAWPAIRLYRKNRARLAVAAPAAPPVDPAGRAFEDDICTFTLPARLDAVAARDLAPAVDEARRDHRHLILDFGPVQFIDSSGLGFLVHLWRRHLGGAAPLTLVALGEQALELFRFNRIADLFQKHIFKNQEEALAHIRLEQAVKGAPYRVYTLRSGTAVVALRGRLDALAMRDFSFDKLLPALDGRNCILDLGQLEFADSTGLVAFHRVQRHVARQGKICTLCSPNPAVLQLLQLTRFDRLFVITDDRHLLLEASVP